MAGPLRDGPLDPGLYKFPLGPLSGDDDSSSTNPPVNAIVDESGDYIRTASGDYIINSTP